MVRDILVIVGMSVLLVGCQKTPGPYPPLIVLGDCDVVKLSMGGTIVETGRGKLEQPVQTYEGQWFIDCRERRVE